MALRLPLTSGYLRRVIRGIQAYNRKNGYWDFPIHNGEPIDFYTWEELESFEGDGIIAPVYTVEQADLLKRKGIPFVNIADSLKASPFPSVKFDNRAIGRMAAKHLLERETPHYAFLGIQENGVNNYRLLGYHEILKRRGFSPSAYWLNEFIQSIDSSKRDSAKVPAAYEKILKNMPRPVSIFAATDELGYRLLEACNRLRIHSPNEVRVLGVNNERILCNLSRPSLSSIHSDCEAYGWEVAKMLDTLMQGKKPEQAEVLIPPERVILRGSTDFLKYEDPYVAEAMRYIHNNASKYIDVSDVMSVVPISRRSLERRFTEQVGRSIYKEITRCHIERAKHLLLNSDQSILQIAKESGFNSNVRFEAAFTNSVGVKASTFRKEAD